MELLAPTPADCPERMNELMWQAMWRHYILPGHRKESDSGFASRINRPDFDFAASVIGRLDDQDAGFCWIRRRGDEAHCAGFGIRPEFRKRGLAGAMLREAAARLRDSGTRVWRLEVVQQNPAAVNAYCRHGFTQTRDLGLYRGSLDVGLEPGESVVEAAAADCLARYQAGWRQVRRTWGASPACLLGRAGELAAKELWRNGQPVAFLLHSGGSVADCGLAPGEPGRAGLKLLSGLGRFSWSNLPEDDPVRPYLNRSPQVNCWVKQWEMEWVL